MKYNILIGGKAGQGPNLLAELVSKGLIEKGYYVFYSRDYQSIIRGGHNFNTISFSTTLISSNPKLIDMLVCLDDKTKELHKNNLKETAIILDEEKNNISDAGKIYKILGLDFTCLETQLKKLKNFEDNLWNAKKGYEGEKRSLNLSQGKSGVIDYMNGNQAIAKGAIESGLDYYYAYPMTPATGVLTELAQEMKNPNNKHITIQLENEVGVINAAIGSAITGAKTMIGTSGGGFDLMTEGLSLIGQAGVPMVLYLSQRPGPATGVATYTGQGDLNMARHCGHGEFSRIVLAPGSIKESIELTSQAFYFSQKYRIPVILMGDKHLAESKFSFSGKPSIQKSTNSITKLERFNSYETDDEKSATEDPKKIIANIDSRLSKQKKINAEVEKFTTYKVYGNKNSRNVVIGWGSTKGAILDSIADIDCKFIQILYLEPFSSKIKREIEGKNTIVVENNATSPLSQLIAEKTGIIIQDNNKILKYDGRPFTSDELNNRIKRLIK